MLGQPGHVLDAGADRVDVLHVAADDGGREHVPQGAVLPARNHDGHVLLERRQHPAVLGVDLVVLLVFPTLQHFLEELVGEVAFALGVGLHPHLEHGLLHAAHGLHLGDAGVRHAVHVAVQEGLLVLGRQVAVVGHALVEVMGHQVEDVLLQVGPGADDEVDLVLADHLGEGEAQLRGAHGPAQGHHHLAALLQEHPVALGGVHQGGGVEVAEVVLHIAADGAELGRGHEILRILPLCQWAPPGPSLDCGPGTPKKEAPGGTGAS